MKILKISLIALMFVSLSSMSNNSTVEKAVVRIEQAHKWEKLGSRVVNMRGDHDEIMVTALNGVFTKVKFRVNKAPIHVNNIRIVFGNGESKNVKIQRKFAPGTDSRVIDLPGNKRIIKKIVFNYKTVPNHKGKAVVVAWGKH